MRLPPVELATEFDLHKPVDARRGKRRLVYFVNNRGNKHGAGFFSHGVDKNWLYSRGWTRAASLLHTDVAGTVDAAVDPSVRLYLVSGIAHTSGRIGFVGRALSRPESAREGYTRPISRGRTQTARWFRSVRSTEMTKLHEKKPGLEPVTMAEAYGITVSDHNGAGRSVAIISMGGQLKKSKLLNDLAKVGAEVNPDNLRIWHVDEKALTAGGDTSETHLDVEVIGSICPSARITIYRGPNDFAKGFAPAVKRAVDDGNQVISISWGASEADWFVGSPLWRAFVHAAKNSVTVTVAAGDGGSGNQQDGSKAVPAADGKVHVDMPAVSPWVLACGGTELMDDGSEHVWNNARKGGGATGGGVSEYVPRPSYQENIDIVSASTRHAGRIIPDVSALGSFTSWEVALEIDGDDDLYYNGGTSAVAPLWAAISVLVNLQRAAAGKGPIGFFNDHLYKLATDNPELLHDVTIGDNRPTRRYPGYSAGTGFDACSGWGTPRNGDHLIKTLAELPDRPASWFKTVK